MQSHASCRNYRFHRRSRCDESEARAYLGRSRLTNRHGDRTLNLVPNLARDPVSFDAPLARPLRFREAISALHDVVINDLRFKPRDKAAYTIWKKEEERRIADLHRHEHRRAKQEILSSAKNRYQPISKSCSNDPDASIGMRLQYSNYLRRNDPELWRMLMPCDPVITVADDVVFFECFSADESSYGCLTVDRRRLRPLCKTCSSARPTSTTRGTCTTTFNGCAPTGRRGFASTRQASRSRRRGNADYREEKIDLPAGWLRGSCRFRRRWACRCAVYAVARGGVFRARFPQAAQGHERARGRCGSSCYPGKRRELVLEPWEQRIVLARHALRWAGG